MLQLTATGNVGKDATITQTGTDHAINFSVATNRKYTNGKGVQVEETKWIDCTIWRRKDESLDIAQYLKAGTKVLVQGEPDVRWYVNGNGEVVTVQTLRVRSQELLSSKKEEVPTPANPEAAAPAATTKTKKAPAPAAQ